MGEQVATASNMAKYTDSQMTSGLKGKTEEEVHDILDAIIRLFCCLHGRDLYLKSYEKELASRLLAKSLISYDYEEHMIQKLKVECGAQQVGKMTQMFKDITQSKETQKEFSANNENTNNIMGVEFNVEILTNGHWPQMEEPTVILPNEIQACSDKFERWYKNAQSNRQLTWLFSNGQVEVAVKYAAKPYQLILNVFQVAILCLFNEQDVVTCSQIKTTTNMQEENFKAAMMRMCDPKVRLLNKEVKKPIFGENEKITVNAAFKSNNIRINLMPVRTHKKKTIAATAEETAQQKQIMKERQFVIQAHCVKVMKAQKTYAFQALVSDVIRNITMFKADPGMIKAQIEVLIRDEYMKRDPNSRAILIYLP